jgi:hypothetical protein
LVKRGKGRFYRACQYNFETVENNSTSCLNTSTAGKDTVDTVSMAIDSGGAP